MNKLLLDTNILLDFMVSERPDSDAAVELFRRCTTGRDTGYVCAGSLKDVYYVASRYLGEQAARDFTYAFLDAFEVIALDKTLCSIAVRSNEPDFEDGLVRAAAEDKRVDLIITRGTDAFGASTIKAVTAKAYIENFCA